MNTWTRRSLATLPCAASPRSSRPALLRSGAPRPAQVAYGAKLVAGTPVRETPLHREHQPDVEVELEIFDRAGEIPVRIEFVGRLVIPVRNIISVLLQTPLRAMLVRIDPGPRIEHRHALAGQHEVIRAIVRALLGRGRRVRGRDS